MPQVRCPNCAARLKVPASAAGKSGKCPRCQERVTFPPEEPEIIDDFVEEDWETPAPPRTKSKPHSATGSQPGAKPSAAASSIPAPLKVLSLLPWGIPVLTLGGVLPCVIAGGLSGACFTIARQKWSFAARVVTILAVVGTSYTGVIVLLIAIGLMQMAPNAAAPNGAAAQNAPANWPVANRAEMPLPPAIDGGFQRPTFPEMPAAAPAINPSTTPARVTVPIVAFVQRGATIRITAEGAEWSVPAGSEPPSNVLFASRPWDVAASPGLRAANWLPEGTDLASAVIEHRGGDGKIEIVEATADHVTLQVDIAEQQHAFFSVNLGFDRH
jgi:hypothetical protein